MGKEGAEAQRHKGTGSGRSHPGLDPGSIKEKRTKGNG